MTGRVIIVTGANSGIGFEVSRYLAEGGNDVVLACRDEEKGKDAVKRIKSLHPNSLVQFMQIDLSSMHSVREFVETFTRKKKKLNVLVNCAGMALNFNDLTRKTTSAGHEVTMTTNHFGPFLLTNLLLDCMIYTSNIMGEGRIVNVTCGLHDHENHWITKNLAYLDVDNFQLQKDGTFSGLQAYKNSKLCNLLFTYHLAEKLKAQKTGGGNSYKGFNVSVNAVDPGVVPTTQLQRHNSQIKQRFTVCCLHNALRFTHVTKTVRKAAAEVCNIADGEKYEGVSGKHFREGVEDRSSPESYDSDLQRAAWKLTCKTVNYRCSLDDDDFDDISLGQ